MRVTFSRALYIFSCIYELDWWDEHLLHVALPEILDSTVRDGEDEDKVQFAPHLPKMGSVSAALTSLSPIGYAPQLPFYQTLQKFAPVLAIVYVVRAPCGQIYVAPLRMFKDAKKALAMHRDPI